MALLVFPLLFCSGCYRPVQPTTVQLVSTTDAVTVTDVRFPSTSIDDVLRYRAVVPTANAGELLPVLYLLHGANSSPAEIMDRSELVKLATAARLIVVMPEADLSYYTNAKHKRHARWEDAIALKLPRDVEARFPLMKGSEHTGIAGISMGGYGAVKLTLKHPERYGFTASMSGPMDITRRRASLRRWGQTWRIWTIFGVRPTTRKGEDVFELLDRAPKNPSANWFLSCGENDPLYAINKRFARRMRERGINLDLISTPGSHDWQSWNVAMPEMFKTAEKSLR
jgi:putative tributyrin esterase